MKNRGVTLVELIVVVAIIAILAVALGFSYQGWMGRYNIEKATKEMFADLTDARARAITMGHAYFAWFTGNQYSIYEDTNDDGVLDIGTDTRLQTFPKTISPNYTLAWTTSPLIFSKKGLISENSGWTTASVRIVTTTDSDYNCVAITKSGMDMAWGTGGSCGAK